MKRITTALVLALVAILLLPSSGFSDQSRRLALVIGNAAYKNSPLRNPVNDAYDMARTLRTMDFEVIHRKNVGQRVMEKAIREFGKQLRKGGVGLFYFAGHGMQVNGRNYLIPIGAVIYEETDIKYEAVDAGRILAAMQNAGNSLNIVILDACRDNPFARSFRTNAQGLAHMDAPTGTLIAYSTAPGMVATDGEGRNAVYTKYFLKYITTPGLTIEQVLKKVRVEVINETGNKQVPWESSSLTGDFYFASKRAIAVVKRPKEEQQRLPVKSRLFVNTEPEHAVKKTVRILNIKQSFYQGMELEPGRYHVEVSALGCETKKKWVKLAAGEDKQITIRLKRLSPRGDVVSLNNQAEALLGTNPKKALDILEKAIELDPNYALAYSNRGYIYLELKEYRKAMQDLNKAIELDPNYAGTYNNRGSAYYKLKQSTKAIQDYNKAIELDPSYAGTYYNRGLAYTDLKQYSKAIQDYTKAIELDPSYAGTHHHSRGIAYYELKQYTKAMQDFNKAIELDPSYAPAYSSRGAAYCNLKQYTKAMQDFNKAIELDPNDATAYSNRGNTYLELKEYRKAMQDLNKAIELDPSYAIAYLNRGAVYGRLKEYTYAIKDCNKAIELDPSYAIARAHSIRGSAFINLGLEDRGCADMRKACEMGDCDGLQDAREQEYCF